MFFSPDSKYLAYDLPASDTALERDVFVIAVDGSQDAPAVVHPAKDVVAGWSPDGSHLLFTSDRASATGLWALPVAGGKPSAAPKLLKPEIGPVSPLGVTASGALHVYKDTSTEALHVAPIDLDSGKLLGVPVAQAYRSSRPDWSRDGKYLAYKSTSDGVNFLSIRSVESGQVRELPPGLQYFSEPRWSPDAGWLVAGARDFKGRGGIYRFDAETGAVSFLAAGSHVSRVDVSPDGKKIYYNYHPDRPHSSYIEHDLASGEVRDVFQPQTETGNLELSPDGRYATTILKGGDFDPAADTDRRRSAPRNPAPERAGTIRGLWRHDLDTRQPGRGRYEGQPGPEGALAGTGGRRPRPKAGYRRQRLA
jgi:dipeptidyl aminopeptidase/acylaminoacyl peptidase